MVDCRGGWEVEYELGFGDSLDIGLHWVGWLELGRTKG